MAGCQVGKRGGGGAYAYMHAPAPAPAAEKGGGDSKRGTAFANCKFASPPALYLALKYFERGTHA